MSHRAFEVPARQVDGISVRVGEFDEFLGLVARGRIEVDAAKAHGGVRRLGGGDVLSVELRVLREQKRPAPRQMRGKDPARLRPHGIAVPPRSPTRIIQVGIRLPNLRRVHGIHHLAHARLDAQVGGWSPRRLQDGVHDRAEAAQDHGAKLGLLKDEVIESVRGFALLGRIVKTQHVVLKECVGEISLRIEPVAAPGQIDVPGQNRPFPRTIVVTVNIVVLVTVILAARERHRDEVADGLGQVEPVPGIKRALAQRPAFIEIVDQGLQVAEVLPTPRLFFVATRAAKIVIHLVERAVRIAPQPFEPAVVAILHHVRDAEELGIPLHPYLESEMSQAPRFGNVIVSQRVAHPRLVAPVRHQPDVFDSRFAGPVTEPVIGGEIEVVTFLGESARALATETDVHVVVKLTGVKEGGPRPGKRVGRSHVLNEQMHHRQRRLNRGVDHDRPETRLRIEWIRIQRPARTMPVGPQCRDVVPDELTRRRRLCRYHRRPEPVSGHRVAIRPRVVHRQGGFHTKQDSIVELDTGDRRKCRGQSRHHGERLGIGRFQRRMECLMENRTKIVRPDTVGPTRRGEGEVPRRTRHCAVPHGDQLGLQQEVGVRGIDVQALDGKAVGPGHQRAQSRGQVEFLPEDRLMVGMALGGRRIPGKRLGRVQTRHLDAVDPGRQSVVVAHPQDEPAHRRWIAKVEWEPEIGCAIDVVKLSADIRREVRPEVHGNGSLKQPVNLRGRKRPRPDRDFVDLPGKRVAGRVKDTTTTDIEGERRASVVAPSPPALGGQHTVQIELQGRLRSQGNDMVPLLFRIRIEVIDTSEKGPELQRRAGNESELDRIVLAPEPRAIGVQGRRPDPPGHGEARTVVQQPGRTAHEIIDAVQVGRPVVGFKIAECRRSRPRVPQLRIAFIPTLAGISQAAEVPGHQSTGLIQSPVKRRVRGLDPRRIGSLGRIKLAGVVSHAVDDAPPTAIVEPGLGPGRPEVAVKRNMEPARSVLSHQHRRLLLETKSK